MMHPRRRTASDLGVRLRSLRDRESVSLGTLAYMLGVSRAALENLENGRSADEWTTRRVRRWLAGARGGGRDRTDPRPRLLPRGDTAR